MSNRLPAYDENGQVALKIELTERPEKPGVLTLDCENMQLAQKRKLIESFDRLPDLDWLKGKFSVADAASIDFYLKPNITEQEKTGVIGAIKGAVWFFCLERVPLAEMKNKPAIK